MLNCNEKYIGCPCLSNIFLITVIFEKDHNIDRTNVKLTLINSSGTKHKKDLNKSINLPALHTVIRCKQDGAPLHFAQEVTGTFLNHNWEIHGHSALIA